MRKGWVSRAKTRNCIPAKEVLVLHNLVMRVNTYARSILNIRWTIVNIQSGGSEKFVTHAHCSIFASACNIAGLPFRFAACPGSTNLMQSSLGGTSGGDGAVEPRPIDDSIPERNILTACRVRSTLTDVKVHTQSAMRLSPSTADVKY